MLRLSGQSDESVMKDRAWGFLSFLLGFLLLLLFFYTLSANMWRNGEYNMLNISLTAFLPGLMFFIIGFHLLFGQSMPLFTRIFPFILMAVGIYLGIGGVLLLIYNFYIGTAGSGFATVIALICAGFVIAGINAYNRGKKERKKVHDRTIWIKDLGNSDSEVRKWAVWRLGNMGGAKVVEPLIQALDDADETVRRWAVEALSKTRDPRAVEPLIQAYKEADLLLQVDIENSFVKMKNAAVEPLIKALKDEDWDVRRFAASTLGKIGDPRSRIQLSEALNDEDEQVRKEAAEALRKLSMVS